MSILIKRKLIALMLFFVSIIPSIIIYIPRIDVIWYIIALVSIIFTIALLLMYSTKISTSSSMYFRLNHLDEREQIVFKDTIKNIILFLGFTVII
jgi:hypothetical protein